MNSPVWHHRPTLVGLAGFCALVITTGVVLTVRLVAPDSRFEGATSVATSDHSPKTPSSNGPVVSVSGVGDIVMGAAPDKLPSDDAAGFFENVTSELSADVVTGNLEGVLSEETGHDKCAKETSSTADPLTVGDLSELEVEPLSESPSCYAFRVPPSYAARLNEAGFTVLNLANNHTRDFGQEGLTNTRTALNEAGVEYTGMQGGYPIVRVGDVTVAVLGFGPYGDMPRVTDIPTAKSLVEQASMKADIVVVHMQAGAEGRDKQHVAPGVETHLGENRGDVMAFSHGVVEAGADLVIGHGPHVLRGMEWYQGKLIAYSMGTFAEYRAVSATGSGGLGGILRVVLSKEGALVSGEFVPTHLVDGGFPAPDPNKQAIASVNKLSEEDFGLAGVSVAQDGTIRMRS